MKKKCWKELAVTGLISGLCALQTIDAAEKPSNPNDQNLSYHLMTEEELLTDLNDDGAKLYMSLSPQGKALAREVASSSCNGTNPCAKLNACKTEKNDCAGKGACKGQGKCAVSDPNLAVKLVAKKMAEKRAGA